ncbi:pimeloyl-ACP methyl ester esterase BioH [Pseudoalteromonas sp. MMG012]|uniref:pimeloyl-ACP methyl ester esterase BioH n=1 Tax=Pseudoalteromonas sp. MMG012 TaxID=2822686 RepID=UPI001B39FA56|nr:pimeloyl-ACP methyl ester esterase BioH [Pseudoalteromonas sp. MMG012]MBQ4850474.1 pimeloyl-ACP methyl ester esterase BioH [Pseudoalteromonas sp. MMG012]
MQNEAVLLHGWGMNAQVWHYVEPDIQAVYKGNVRSINLPGFGGACSPAGDYSLASAAELLAKQLHANSILIGWSLGGLFALYLAKHFPEKVSKVILIASTPYFCEQQHWLGIKPDVLNTFQVQLQNSAAKTIERFLAIQAMGSENAREDIKHLRALLAGSPAPDSRALKAGLEILKREDLRAEMSVLPQPIFGLFGRLDSLVPKGVITQICKLNPQFNYEVLPKASHAPFISHRQEFITFLKSVL